MYEHNTIFYFQSTFLYIVCFINMSCLITFCTGLCLLPMLLLGSVEPTALDRADGKQPDGITMVPWSNGRLLVWDATCADTFATSHVSITASEVCAAANQAEQTKIKMYNYITSHVYHSFTPAHNFWSLRLSLHVFFDGLGSPHFKHHR